MYDSGSHTMHMQYAISMCVSAEYDFEWDDNAENWDMHASETRAAT